MLVKIIKCSDGLLWYNHHMGEEFKVLWTEYDTYLGKLTYWTREGGIYNATNWILQDDCEVVNHEPVPPHKERR